MAKATLHELPNQQLTTQNQTPNIPRPRSRSTKTHKPQAHIETNSLFIQEVSEDKIAQASQYIEAAISSEEAIKAGAFLIAILEKLGSIPYELSAEDEAERQRSIVQIEELVLELQDFLNQNDTLNSGKFQEQVVEVIGRENTVMYPVVALLRGAKQKLGNKGNREIESQLRTTQQIALLGIAKQIRSQK